MVRRNWRQVDAGSTVTLQIQQPVAVRTCTIRLPKSHATEPPKYKRGWNHDKRQNQRAKPQTGYSNLGSGRLSSSLSTSHFVLLGNRTTARRGQVLAHSRTSASSVLVTCSLSGTRISGSKNRGLGCPIHSSNRSSARVVLRNDPTFLV